MAKSKVKSKKKKTSIILSTDLETVLKGYVPTIGDLEDINIVLALSKLNRKLSTIDNEAFRKAQKEKRPLTNKMKEIDNDEKQLIFRIKKRNFDF